MLSHYFIVGTQRKERKPSANSKLPTKRSRADSTDNIVNSTSGSPNPAKVCIHQNI